MVNAMTSYAEARARYDTTYDARRAGACAFVCRVEINR